MTEEENVSLETDHLEEVIETSPPSQPVVVIQYRTRGVPWSRRDCSAARPGPLIGTWRSTTA